MRPRWHRKKRVAGSAGLGGFRGYCNGIDGHLGEAIRAPGCPFNAVARAVDLSALFSASSVLSVPIGSTRRAQAHRVRRADPTAERPIKCSCTSSRLFSVFMSVGRPCDQRTDAIRRIRPIRLILPPLVGNASQHGPDPRQPMPLAVAPRQWPFMSAGLILRPPATYRQYRDELSRRGFHGHAHA